MSGQAPRVLIIERNDGLRLDLARAIQVAGYEVESASHSKQAAQCLDARRFEAVVVEVEEEGDLRLLGMAVAKPSCPAVVATGTGRSTSLVVGAMKAGAKNFLRRPFRVGALEEALRRAVERPLPRVGDFETRDPKCEQLLREAAAAAVSDVTILIVGEAATGKELLARSIHRASERSNAPFVVIDCATPDLRTAHDGFLGLTLFTGEAHQAPSVLRAEDGTVLLREVDELSSELQSMLLRGLQDSDLRWQVAGGRDGLGHRFVATTRRELSEEVSAGRFRRDLFYRLDVVVLRVPPLRERPCDIPLIANRFLEQIAHQTGCDLPILGETELDALARLPLRGNARELENLMRRASLLFPGERVDAERLLSGAPRQAVMSTESDLPLNLRELERRTILRSLEHHGGNRTHASRALGISVRTLRNKIRSYGLRAV